MKTPRKTHPVPWLNRRDQYRMLAMVGLLCLVMLAIKLAARPSSWHWLLPPGSAETQTADAGRQVTLKELDFRVRQDAHEPLPPGVFRSVAARDDSGPIDDTTNVDEGNDPEPVQQAADTAVAPELLAGIEDNTIGVRKSEVDAYYLMLDKVRRLPDDVRTAQADGDVAFTVIMLQPEGYRGRLIRITGRLHRLNRYPVMENDYGIDQLYEGWVFTGDSGNNPWRFVCTELPNGISPGESIDPVKVRVEGYFFKRMGYASKGGQHVAPTLLAASFDVLPTPVSTAPQMQAQMQHWMLGFWGVVIAGVGVLIWWFISSDRRFAGSRVHELVAARLDADQDDLKALQHLDTQDPATLFADGVDVAE